MKENSCFYSKRRYSEVNSRIPENVQKKTIIITETNGKIPHLVAYKLYN